MNLEIFLQDGLFYDLSVTLDKSLEFVWPLLSPSTKKDIRLRLYNSNQQKYLCKIIQDTLQLDPKKTEDIRKCLTEWLIKCVHTVRNNRNLCFLPTNLKQFLGELMFHIKSLCVQKSINVSLLFLNPAPQTAVILSQQKVEAAFSFIN